MVEFFEFLTAPARSVKGIGPQASLRLNQYMARKVKIPDYNATIGDMLRHVPYDYIDRRIITPLGQARDGVCTVCVHVTAYHRGAPARARGGRRPSPYRVMCEDATGSMVVLFFRGDNSYITKQLPLGSDMVISGNLQRHEGIWQMTHPDIIAPADDASSVCRIDPIYPTTEGISSRMMSRWIATILSTMPASSEWLRASTVQHYGWPSHADALRMLHRPDDMNATSLAALRLAYDEALAHQLALQCLRMCQQRQPAISLALRGSALVERVIDSLPFALTQGQVDVLDDIHHDIAGTTRMLRLLQGDVGAGKTVVAVLSALAAIDAGYQAAIMAPTEILARQHMQSIDTLCGILDVPVIFLAGSLTVSQRRAALEQIATQPAALIIGTHALFQEGVVFSRLALVVIDEQHRFGVAQRLALSDKGMVGDDVAPHMLLMTATPIPRSLQMAQYGDMDVSQLRQKPAGRQAIDTRLISMGRMNELLSGIGRALSAGDKIYWICPLVEESTAMREPDQVIQAAIVRAQALELLFPGKVGLVHGKMPMKEREPVMQRFVSGECRILVATTVVEVGVDVPDATVMVIENAERFGMAQLHQLRGRVGRGDKPSRCLLVYQEQCSATAHKRLETMRNTNDGFEIAESDLTLRGGGELLGTRQTGLPDYAFLDVERHGALMKAARREAQAALADDIMLSSERGQLLRRVLAFFHLDDAMKYLSSG